MPLAGEVVWRILGIECSVTNIPAHFADAWIFAIALGYAVTDLQALYGGINSYPLANIYQQATGSQGATFGLLFIIFCATFLCCVGTMLTVRDAIPLSLFATTAVRTLDPG